MQFSTKTTSPDRLKTDCLIVPVLAGKALTVGGKSLDAACGQRLSAALKSGDLASKAGATLLLHLDGPAARALLVSLGDEREPTEKAFVEAARGAVRHLGTLGAAGAASLLHEAPAGSRGLDWKIRTQVMAARDAGYRFDAMKSRKDAKPPKPGALVFVVGGADTAAAGQAIEQAEAVANGMALAKDLGNLPPNVCTPAYLAAEARKLGRSHKMKIEVLEQRQMQALRMGALLAVAQGSELPPKFIVMHWNGGGAKQAPVVLVGKGITFDTGGISLKPAAEMDEMKYDMSGAGSVLGTMRAVAEMKLPLNVIGVVPTCENMPSGKATRPGDVVTSMSGQTIEILNTDAEGRLILCDALTYVERFKPAAVIDIATLTGACVVALGAHHSGLFSKDDALADELVAAGRDIADTCWRMPVDEDYAEALKSNFADMGNVGGRAGGAITAACFLAKFTKAYPWAHLDIAGTAWRSGAQKGSSGRPVPLLANFLIGRARG